MTTTRAITLEPGKLVSYQGRNFRITRIMSLNEVELVDDLTDQIVKASLQDLQSPETVSSKRPDLACIKEKDWETARNRLNIIRPLLNQQSRTRSMVADVGKQHATSTNTIYTWLKAYENSESLSALLPKIRKDSGTTKMPSQVEEIIKEVIASEYLSKQKKSQQKVSDEVAKRCKELSIPAPHPNTVRNRIKALSPEMVSSKREGRKTADLSFRLHEGQFPGADWPLAVVQVDHTKLDIILVDDHYRHPIGRPWITLAFDVFSRMVTGFYVSFDPPSALSTGLCLAQSILPKEKYLAKFNVKGEWPVWGLPAVVHVDNAKEFRGNMLKRACDEYGIDLVWRPVGRPNFGAHIERALGTLASEIHTLPGTTFSDIKARGEYKSEKKAVLTLTEFEEWLTIYIVDVYHQKLHSSLATTPMAMYKNGIFGDAEQPGSGLPARIADEERLQLDFMPFEFRTVQDYGIVMDEIHYSHDVLRRWINAPDLEDSKKKRKFTVRRDPRDISQVWFYDPEVNEYYTIPYRDTSHPAISIWELREARKRALADGRRHISEHAVFEAYDRMREIEEESMEKSKAAKRARQRRKHHAQADRPATNTSSISMEIQVDGQDHADIQPFDEMDDLP